MTGSGMSSWLCELPMIWHIFLMLMFKDHAWHFPLNSIWEVSQLPVTQVGVW